MISKTMLLLTVLSINGSVSAQESSATSVQTPNSVAADAKAISDRFIQILEEECPVNICNAIGCETTRFQTLDENQDSSLPGMGTGEATAKSVQYKLASVRCEFTYEPTFDEKKLASLRQRLTQRVRQGNVAIQLVSRKLLPKEEIASSTIKPLGKTVDQSASSILLMTFAPFLPWLTILFLLAVTAVTVIFLLKRPKRLPVIPGMGKPSEDDAGAKIPAAMLMDRTVALRAAYQEHAKLAELAIRPLLESGDLEELCRILKHFGPELITPFKERGQFSARLDELAEKYQSYEGNDSTVEFWQFLERSDRRLTAAKVRIASEPLKDEFGFMDNMNVDELIGLLRELTEAEGIAIVVNGPARLRAELFTKAGSRFVTTFIAYLGGNERLSDQFVRTSVQKARKIFEEKGSELKVVQLNRVPLFEEALNALGSTERHKLIVEMQKSQPAVLSAMAPRMFLDASLAKIPDEVLTEAFLQVTPKAAAAYIDSLAGEIEVMSRLKPRLQEAIKRYIGQDLVDLGLVKEARSTISQYIKDRDAAGVIDLGKINASLLQ